MQNIKKVLRNLKFLVTCHPKFPIAIVNSWLLSGTEVLRGKTIYKVRLNSRQYTIPEEISIKNRSYRAKTGMVKRRWNVVAFSAGVNSICVFPGLWGFWGCYCLTISSSGKRVPLNPEELIVMTCDSPSRSSADGSCSLNTVHRQCLWQAAPSSQYTPWMTLGRHHRNRGLRIADRPCCHNGAW